MSIGLYRGTHEQQGNSGFAGLEPERNGVAFGGGYSGRLVCKPWNRIANFGSRSYTFAPRRRHPLRKRHIRGRSKTADGCSGPMADKCRKAACDAATGRRILQSGGKLWNDSGRPSGPMRTGWISSGAKRRSRQLVLGLGRGTSRRRSDGPRGRRKARLGHHGSPGKRRAPAPRYALFLSCYSPWGCRACLYQFCGLRRGAAGILRSEDKSWLNTERSAETYGRTIHQCLSAAPTSSSISKIGVTGFRQIRVPPLTSMIWPVIHRDSSDAKKRMTSTTSPG